MDLRIQIEATLSHLFDREIYVGMGLWKTRSLKWQCYEVVTTNPTGWIATNATA